MRLFISINVPKELHHYLEQLQNQYPNLKKTRDFHLTVQFLGNDLSEHETETIMKSLKKIQFEPFEIEMGDCLPFPTPDRPRLVWVECDLSGALMKLANEIRASMEELGYINDKPFKAHITLGRYKKSPHKEPAIIHGEIHRFTVDRFSLTESVQTESGHQYKKLGAFGA